MSRDYHHLRIEEFVGKKFGKLLVKEFSHKIGPRLYFSCLCDCGNRCTVMGNKLFLGRPKSCGCMSSEHARGPHPHLIKDITGRRFGRLTVVNISHRKLKTGGGGLIFWKCLCDCGKTVVVPGSQLKGGLTKSCGCLHSEIVSKRNRTHGESNTRLWSIWSGIIKRCENANCINYHRYGGRGITICSEWRYNFSAFRTWALCNGYADNLTIDRVDNDGHYRPANCQWLTRSQNAKKMHVDARDRA